MKKILVLVIAIFIGNIANAQWQQLSSFPTNGNASSIFIINDTIIISSNNMGYIGMYISNDNGVSWSSIITNSIIKLNPLFKNGNNFFAGSWNQGLFLSNDNCNTWTQKNNGLPSNFGLQNMSFYNNDYILCGNGGIYKSTNNANTWQNIGFTGVVNSTSAVKLGNTIFSFMSTQNTWSLYKSTNNGNSWSSTNLPASYTFIYKFFTCNNIIFSSNGMNPGLECLYFSNDTGNTWIASNGLYDQGNNYVYNILSNNGELYLASYNGCYKSIDNGYNWIKIFNYCSESVAIKGDTLFIGTTNHGIWKRSITELTTSIPVNIINQPIDTLSACLNSSNVPISVKATGASPFTYQWQYYDSIYWNNVTNGIPAGAIYTNGNKDTLKISGINLSGFNQYRCIITNCNGLFTAISDTTLLIINPSPYSAGIISGSTNVTAGQQNVQYSIPSITNATSYIWTLPNGSTGISTTNSIFVNYGSTAISGNIIVKGTNSCGDGLESSLYITVNPFVANCSAQFDLVVDTTTPHNYFAVNNASGIHPLQYNWSWGDGTHDTTAYPTHTYFTSGYYYICLTITDSVGCTVTYCDSTYLQKSPNAIISIEVIPQGTLGVRSISTDNFKIYPNPAKDNLIIELQKSKNLQNTSVSIYNTQGQLVKQLTICLSKTEIDIHNLSIGVYMVKVINNKETLQGKFVKE